MLNETKKKPTNLGKCVAQTFSGDKFIELKRQTWRNVMPRIWIRTMLNSKAGQFNSECLFDFT